MAPIRLGGMASGLDTDRLIKDIMKTEKFRVDKVDKERIRLEWSQTALRDMIGKIRGFHGKYFDLLNPEKNMLSPSSFSVFDYTVTSGGTATNAVQISAKAGAVKTDNVIDRITQLASADVWSGSGADLASIKGSAPVGMDALKAATTDLDFGIVIGKAAKKITVTSAELQGMSDVGDLATLMNQKIKAAFGEGFDNVVSVRTDGSLRLAQKGNQVKLYKAGESPLFGELKITSGSGSYDYKKKSIGAIFGLTDADFEDFEINGKKVKLSAGMTMDEMFRAINTSDAGVNLHYDSLSDKMVMRSSETGSANNLKIADGSKAEIVLSKLFGVSDLVDASGEAAAATVAREKGKNANLVLNGTEIVQGSNSFAIDGITYTLNALSNTPIHTDAKPNTEKIFENIKSFIEDYNTLISEIDKKITEPRFRKYEPLTEDEKSEVSEKMAEKLEEKAKSGILNGNRDLQRMLEHLRKVMIDNVEGGVRLSSIGIQSMNWRDKGKLTVDPAKLKHAIENDLDRVVETFTKASDIPYGETEKAKERYAQNGLVSRMDDVLKDFVRTTRDKDGNKGTLLMAAGMEGDSSAQTNKITKEIRKKEKRIDYLMEMLAKKEDYYYKMFAQMESSLSKMQSQQATFANFIAGMNRG